MDISKCLGDGCPKKERCYRYTSKGDPTWQSYVEAKRLKDGSCELFWDTEERNKGLRAKIEKRRKG